MGLRFFACPKCGRKAALDEERYMNLHVHIRCRKCRGTWWEVVVPARNTPGSEPAVEPEPSGEATPEEKEARRLARFIVSEIKLYHQSDIERAATRREVFESVKKDLELGRRHYLGRIPPGLQDGARIFDQVVEEILYRGKK